MNYRSPSPDTSSGWTLALILGLLAFLLSASRINHGLVDSPLPAGPGLTTDESINIQQGLYLFDAFSQHGPLMMFPGKAQEVYGDSGYMADYVPLGRFLLGACHELTAWMISGAELSVVNVPAARLTSSAALALTVVLMVLFTRRRYGTLTAIMAAVLFLLMPRVVGHSRIASLETLTTLAWFAAMLPLLAWWTGRRPPTVMQAGVSGVMWGVLMLVKIQSVFLPPIITIYAFALFRWRAFVPLSVMAVIGLMVFFCGWPWLWLDPVNNTRAYLMSTQDRATIHNWYLAFRYLDKETPWHFPFVMAAVTIPLHTCCCLLLRGVQGRLDSVEWLLVTSIAVPMLVFAIPGTPVYDGTRLFLVVMPAVAILGARGFTILLAWVCSGSSEEGSPEASRRLVRPLALIASILLLIDAAATVPQLGPFAIDSYNNAARLLNPEDELFDSSYWGDALNGDFWQQVPEGSTVAVAPVLHPVLLPDMMRMTPVLQQRNITLDSFYYDPLKQRGLVLLLHRLAELPPNFRHPPAGNEPLIEVRLQGRVLARLVDTTESTWKEQTKW